MNKKNKFLLSLGTATVAISPVAVIVSCGTDNRWQSNPTESVLVGGKIKQEDALKNDEAKEVIKSQARSFIEHEYAFFNYNNEQKASVKMQEAIFAWDYHKLLKTKNRLKNIDKDDQKVKNNEKAISHLKHKMRQIAKGLPTSNSLYKSSDFSRDYSKILRPLEIIKKEQEDIFQNQKESYITGPAFSTRAEGEVSWLKELPKKYKALTEREAIEKLVFDQINANSNLRNMIAVNDTFTIEQLKWANLVSGSRYPEEDKTKNYFDFLKVDDPKKLTPIDMAAEVQNKQMTITGTDKLDKVYFYGTKSNIFDLVKINDATKKLEDGGMTSNTTKKPLRLYRHVLLNIRQNKDGRTLPWTASADLIKSLMKFVPGSTSVHEFSRIGSIFDTPSTFNAEVSDQTQFFLNQVSNNGGGSKGKGGSLGIHPATYYSAGMFDGFALGALAIEKVIEEKRVNEANDGIYTKLQAAIEDAYNEVVQGNTFSSQEALIQYLDHVGEEELTKIFGTKIRDLFDPKAGRSATQGFSTTSNKYNSESDAEFGRSLVYTQGTNNTDAKFLIISNNDKGGIHLTKKFDINSSEINTVMLDELKEMAKLDEKSSTQFDIVGLLKPFLTNERNILQLTKPSPAAGSSAEKFTTFLKDKYKGDADILKDIDANIKNAHDEILKELKILAQTKATGISNAHSKFLVNGIDNKQIAYYPYTTTSGVNLDKSESLTPDEIYERAYKLAKLEYGGL